MTESILKKSNLLVENWELIHKEFWLEKSLITNEKVWINGGTMYGRDGFMRINLACPRERLEEGLKRIGKGFKRLLEK